MKTKVLLSIAALCLLLALPAARIYAATPTNYVHFPDAGTVSFPSTSGQDVTAEGSSGSDLTNFTLSSTTVVDIFVGDCCITGDQYQVSVDGELLFTTDYIGPSISGVSTGQNGCNGTADVQDNLSWGDASVTLSTGTHTINVTDISSTLADYPAGYCLFIGSPPSFSTPQFPLGLPLLLAVTMIGLVIVRKSVLPNVKRTV